MNFETRPSTSPFIERVWRCRSGAGGPFLSMAEGNVELVVSQFGEARAVTLRGPVTRACFMDCPRDGEWTVIHFALGVFFPDVPTASLLDHEDMPLPVLPRNRFCFAGEIWQIPTFDDAEDLVARLRRAGVIARSPVADAAAESDARWIGRRSLQRHFLRATGITLAGYTQIQRARRAADLLIRGASILDATFEAGYFDQAHLTRATKRLIGMTPARLQRERPQLSFSYKTETGEMR